MRTSFFLTLAFIITRVWAGGYQGALERLMLYYAFEIDELNDPAQRTIGVGCVRDNWRECRPKPITGRSRCNFNDLMVHLGKLDTDSPKLVHGADQNTKTPDITETAKNVYEQFVVKQGKSVPNFQAFKAMKGLDGNFNEFIKRLAQTVAQASSRQTAANKVLFDNFKTSLNQVKIVRAGDHGAHLIDAAEKELGIPNGMEIKKEALGINPVDGNTMYTLDWKATILAAEANGIENASKMVKDWQKKWYGPLATGAASKGQEHSSVIRSYKGAQKIMSTGCS
ncbi:hypothetical protein BKA56DRAFT_634142 [Ilyonectria sp. MPI-CAGE-AT-0026]|nr:hypothetical protein BKA56DRAFT_634142 [Ilyonectria sp. MPI-CAGE-AT-0026]